MKSAIAWHKNQWLNIENIFIPLNDRGLKFGDGVFETILIKKNKPVLFDEHFKRLENSSKILNINFKLNKDFLERLINEGITKLFLKKNEFASVRINYSRGINKGRSLNIKSSLETKNLDNLWLEFYQINPNFPVYLETLTLAIIAIITNF